VTRRSGEAPPQARSAAISPVSGANLAPWPERGEQTTKGPYRSRMKSSFPVDHAAVRMEHDRVGALRVSYAKTDNMCKPIIGTLLSFRHHERVP
jgi:hypothetical protein